MIDWDNICDLLKLARTCETINWGGAGDMQELATLWGAPITVYTFGGSGVPSVGKITLPDETLVCIAGTTTSLQWAQQVALSPLVPSPDTAGDVNAFYALAGHRIRLQLGLIPGASFWTGHSMGGALAYYMHSFTRALTPFSRAVAFGAPRVGNAAFAASLQDARSYWTRGDPIPLIPPALLSDYRHGGKSFTLEYDQPQPGAVAAWLPDPAKHYTSEYIERLEAMTGADACDAPPPELASLNQFVADVAANHECHCP